MSNDTISTRKGLMALEKFHFNEWIISIQDKILYQLSWTVTDDNQAYDYT